MNDAFTPDQKQFLEGFFSGVEIAKTKRASEPSVETRHEGPDAIHLAAQDDVLKRGGKLSDQEKWKRDQHPFDAYPRLREQAEKDELSKPADNFRWRYFGLFNVAPAQNSYMCRLRIPNGVLSAAKFAGVADLAEKFGGGFAHVTTRANLQFREIPARNAVAVIEGIQDLGLVSRGSGADNIRNVTGDATAGISAQELIDTRPFAREWHYHILNDRSLFGLPRKFNVAYDGGGPIPTLEDTNDIGFQAIEVAAGAPVEPGIWFRLVLGGITGHRDLARDTGVILKPKEATPVADAIVRAFAKNGDRTSRNKARLKYVLDAMGFDAFLREVEAILGRQLQRIDAVFVLPRPAHDRLAHVGVHPQKQAGHSYIGVALPVGKMTSAQMRQLASIATAFGDGDIRLTVWQNLLISGVPDASLEDAKAAIEACGFDWRATSIRAGLVACTGSAGCKFAGADTKAHAEQIASWCEARVVMDSPVNIHLTGCHHSCAQHYIGDIGLIGARVPINDEGDTVDGYHILVGGGFGDEGAIAQDLMQNVVATDAPATVERILKAYLAHRAGETESFHAFSSRCGVDALRTLMAEPVA